METLASATLEPNPNWSMLLFGVGQPLATFGHADGGLQMHICARDGEYQGAPLVPGNAPFTVQIKVDGNLIRTIENVPACVDYAYVNFDPAVGPICEVNCSVNDLPQGRYDIVATDVIGNDVRGILQISEVQPPYATLNGTVDPNGLDTTVWFDFGLTTEYDRIAEFGIVNGTVPVNCSIRLKSKVEGSTDPTEYLEEGTTYHYRIRATNSMGSSTGEDMTFTTPTYVAPPVAVTLPATNIG
jgi:hypothetical protein